MDIITIVALIAMSGLFSGLTIGLMGLSYSEVKRSADLGNQNAKVVLGLIKESNLLLVTLLLGNTAVNSTLSIFLSGIVGTGLIAGIVATSLILVFGEILPASLLSKHALKVGALTAPLVRFLIRVTYVISKPIAMLLDKYVGIVGETFFSRKEFIHIISTHKKSNESDIDDLDLRSVIGIMLLTDKLVKEHMSQDIYFLREGTLITTELIDEIKEKGFTRIPIMNKDMHVVTILHAKDLLNFGTFKELNLNVEDLGLHKNKIFRVNAEAKLDNVLSYMIKNKLHIAIVKSFDTVVGVITLEDIIEEVLLHEIVDEFDKE